jgi:cyclopropane fatty-acyl-phospholipid synthase-like methyltransferase
MSDGRAQPGEGTISIADYYERKTQQIVERYGPGPRIHYHTGLIDEPQAPCSAIPLLRRRLVAAQERMLAYAADVWGAARTLNGRVLDVGCGLGGGAIFWAQEFGAGVTAVTCVPSHLDLVARFAAEAGVTPRVRPLLCDAHAIPGKDCFDTAIAIDSSGYFERGRWFRHLAHLLRRNGHVFIFDCFLGDAKYKALFRRHWHCGIGSMEEYLDAASAAGFVTESIEDVSPAAARFWSTTLALIGAETREAKSHPSSLSRLEDSARAHAEVLDGVTSGGLRHLLISFVRT